MPCPKGFYIDTKGGRALADCEVCEAGYFCNIGTTHKGTICPQGYYCPFGSYQYQYPCPAGYYGGKRTGLKELTECQLCPAGFYCPEATADPIPAPKGYYNPYMGAGKLEYMTICPPKHPCPITGLTSYKSSVCQLGYYCPAGTVNPNDHPCPAGTFSDSPTIFMITECLSCPPGFACPQASTSASFQTCPAGYFCPNGTKTINDVYLSVLL